MWSPLNKQLAQVEITRKSKNGRVKTIYASTQGVSTYLAITLGNKLQNGVKFQGCNHKGGRYNRGLVKFGLSEKHTKFEKIFLIVLINQLIYLVNVKTMRKIFSNFVCFSESPNFTKAAMNFHRPKEKYIRCLNGMQSLFF